MHYRLRRRLILVTLVTLIVYYLYTLAYNPDFSLQDLLIQNINVANSTLGFESIVAISLENTKDLTAWKQKGLNAAARRTGLSIKVHQQDNPPVGSVAELIYENPQHHPAQAPLASALIWNTHLQMLRKYEALRIMALLIVSRILLRKTTSTLIMEDDVDWDLDIRRQLAPNGPIATTIRGLTSTDTDTNIKRHPFGTKFDVIWLGHCGMRSTASDLFVTVPDEYMLPLSNLTGLDNEPLKGFSSNHTRQVHLGHGTSCSYAYAITWQAARKLIPRLKQGQPFDVDLNNACRDVLTCLIVHPGLISRHQRADEVAKNRKLDQTAPPHSHTPNVRYSARCNTQWWGGSDRMQCLP